MLASERKTLRNREPARIISAEEAAQCAAELRDRANAMPVGYARMAVLREAAKFQSLADIKRYLDEK